MAVHLKRCKLSGVSRVTLNYWLARMRKCGSASVGAVVVKTMDRTWKGRGAFLCLHTWAQRRPWPSFQWRGSCCGSLPYEQKPWHLGGQRSQTVTLTVTHAFSKALKTLSVSCCHWLPVWGVSSLSLFGWLVVMQALVSAGHQFTHTSPQLSEELSAIVHAICYSSLELHLTSFPFSIFYHL